jgi:hypothetical protein
MNQGGEKGDAGERREKERKWGERGRKGGCFVSEKQLFSVFICLFAKTKQFIGRFLAERWGWPRPPARG